MQLPDEAIEYHYQRLLAPPPEAWTPLAELQAQHFLPPGPARGAQAAARSQSAARSPPSASCSNPPAEDCSRSTPASSTCRRRPSTSTAARATPANSARSSASPTGCGRTCDRVVVLGHRRQLPRRPRPSSTPCATAYHNELPAEAAAWASRASTSRATTSTTTPSRTCSNCWRTPASIPTCAEERWGVVVVSKSGGTLETAAAYRAVRARGGEVLRAEVAECSSSSSSRSPGRRASSATCAGPTGYADDDILTIPDNVGGRYSRVHAGRPAAGGGDGPGRAGAAARGRGHDQAVPGGAVRAQPGPAVRRRQLPDDRGAAASRSACWRSGRRSWRRSACGTTSCCRESLGKHGRGADAADGGADPRPAQPRPAAPGRPAGQGHQQPGRADAEAPADHDRHGRPQRGRPERRSAARGCPDLLEAALQGDEPGLLRRRPADGRPRAAGAVRAHDRPAAANAHAGHGGRGPADGRQPLRPAGRRGVQAEHDAAS